MGTANLSEINLSQLQILSHILAGIGTIFTSSAHFYLMANHDPIGWFLPVYGMTNVFLNRVIFLPLGRFIDSSDEDDDSSSSECGVSSIH